jgi:hypothetical protein
MRTRTVALGLAAVLVLAVVTACGGDQEQLAGETGTPSGAASPGAAELSAVIISSDIAIGSNRFMVGLVTPDSEVITDAQVQFGFFKLNGDQGELRSEAQATVIKMIRGIVRENPDGTRETVELGETAAYAADVNFDEPGDWAVRIIPTRGGTPLAPIQLKFTVQEKNSSVAIGEPAPSSRQLTLADVSDLSEIDTADPPDPEWHRMTIADAVGSGKPVAIAFTTPGFCESQMCAPMTQELAMLYEKYKDRVIFIHVEPYFLDRLRAGQCPSLGECAVPTMKEWGLQTEPWIFIVDAEGKVAAKFEAFVMMDEIEAALKAALGGEQ